MTRSPSYVLRFGATALVLTAGLLHANPARSVVRPTSQFEAASPQSAEARELIRQRLEVAMGPAERPAAGERIHSEISVRRFYENRRFEPAWTADGTPTTRLNQLLQAIRRADRHGLRPGDYHLAEIRETVSRLRSGRRSESHGVRAVAHLDLLATDAYLLLASHLLSGRVDPETFETEWVAQRRTRDLVAHLQEALRTDEVEASLHALDPPQSEYARLMRGLDRYRSISLEGGWPTIPSGPTLRPNDEDDRVPTLRKRLEIEGYDVGEATGNTYDPGLEDAVRGFQNRHGLDADGVVGPQTLQELNVSADARVDQIVLNLERWRWLPQELGTPHVLVNIAGFRLDVIEEGRSVMDMRVIVGRPYRTTPVFSDRITYLAFSPYWNVPHSIAAEDILPQVKQNTEYLRQENLRVLQGWDIDSRPIDPDSIDWSGLTSENFPYRLRQDPGPNNALGTVKFMFPNRFNVYLHDTPARALFSEAVRTFSSGCIRIERPDELAAYLLRDRSEWTADRIQQARSGGSEQTVYLSDPVPVHLLYWTAWVDDADTIHFQRDVYGRDARLETALSER